MSIQSARAFLAKVAEDEEFHKALDGCKSAAEKQQFVRGAGFEFTADEMKAAGSELQDADLGVISGGVGCTHDCGSGYGPAGA